MSLLERDWTPEEVAGFLERTGIDASVHPIGTFPFDHNKCCADCAKENAFDKNAYRQCYSEPDKDAGLQPYLYVGKNGKVVKSKRYPLKYYDYCYYHCKVRGLLPYQKGKKWNPSIIWEIIDELL